MGHNDSRDMPRLQFTLPDLSDIARQRRGDPPHAEGGVGVVTTMNTGDGLSMTRVTQSIISAPKPRCFYVIG